MNLTLILLIVLGVAALIVFGLVVSFFSVWLRALLAGAPVSIFNLVAMRLRQVPYSVMVDARIRATKAGINLSIDDIEAQYLAGGNVIACVQALIAAQKAGIALDWQRACAIDLATKGSGKSVEEAVRTSVDPKVIDCPNPEGGRVTIDGVAKDGIQVKVKARVTVRTNLDRFVGGAKEDTIIARVGEGIVSTIGSSESYKSVRESPDAISKTVLHRGLDVGTAFEILSIDIADVDV
ncbi:MAG TPA: flotillin-like FloA family protein, partial [Opitutus sp.]|nr:flotillin-like FloA family protein [Opitutus sp.]